MPKAILIHEHGGPEVMRWEDVEVGKPGRFFHLGLRRLAATVVVAPDPERGHAQLGLRDELLVRHGAGVFHRRAAPGPSAREEHHRSE